MKNLLLRGAACALFLLPAASRGASGQAPVSAHYAAIDAALERALEAVDKASEASAAHDAAKEHTDALWALMSVLHYEKRLPAIIDSATGANPAQRANAHFFAQRSASDLVAQMVFIVRGQIDARQARAMALAYATPVGQQALAGVKSAAVDAFNAAPEARLLAASEQATKARMQDAILAWADFQVVTLLATASARANDYNAMLHDPARRGTLPADPQPTGHADIDRMMSASLSMVRDSTVLAWRLDDELDRLGRAQVLSRASLTSVDGTARARRSVALMRPPSQAFIVAAKAVVARSRAQLRTNGVAPPDRLTAVMHAVFDKRLVQLVQLDILQRQQYDIVERMLAFAGERPGQLILAANGVDAPDSAARTRWLALLSEMQDNMQKTAAVSAPAVP
ncbi:hypothetical protein PO883_10150 [Massilia sp. DJPM01]|uniref:hypothetical protein n=1 Tax=Massilia sp. DJPM01 TaxID=3024404 RepID=UPI00259E6F00|nr:hypothetical protein [Massilia sp. DJPM01]MDM5177552.1 hypothetical protein [Massilia sp. DJPM01]